MLFLWLFTLCCADAIVVLAHVRWGVALFCGLVVELVYVVNGLLLLEVLCLFVYFDVVCCVLCGGVYFALL